MRLGDEMLAWAKSLWPLPRSLTGHGTVETLKYLKGINPDLRVKFRKTGDAVFDWIVPDEWNIYDAYLVHENGEKFADFKVNNLHVVGYSEAINERINLNELQARIHTHDLHPDRVPYVTSYYSSTWGFCMSENQKKKMPNGEYLAYINAKKEPGRMHYADLVIKGKSENEVFFSTYICHPSMANNELSGPVVASALARHIRQNFPDPQYTYRFVFAPETIGALAYLDENISHLRKTVICGFNLSCVGDERCFSHIQSRTGKTLADSALSSALIGKQVVKTYSYLDRGSDERQYGAPLVDLPFCGFCRSKYGEYPEYHTDADNFDIVTADGLHGSFELMANIIRAFEFGLHPKSKVIGEPQLGKRGLSPTLSKIGSRNNLKTMMNCIAYADGQNTIFDICNIAQASLAEVLEKMEVLRSHEIIE